MDRSDKRKTCQFWVRILLYKALLVMKVPFRPNLHMHVVHSTLENTSFKTLFVQSLFWKIFHTFVILCPFENQRGLQTFQQYYYKPNHKKLLLEAFNPLQKNPEILHLKIGNETHSKQPRKFQKWETLFLGLVNRPIFKRFLDPVRTAKGYFSL